MAHRLTEILIMQNTQLGKQEYFLYTSSPKVLSYLIKASKVLNSEASLLIQQKIGGDLSALANSKNKTHLAILGS